MLKKKLQPIGIPKSQASSQTLMLELLSKLLYETRQHNELLRQFIGKQSGGEGVSPTRNTKYDSPYRTSKADHHELIEKKSILETPEIEDADNNTHIVQPKEDIISEQSSSQKLFQVLTKMEDRLMSTQELNKKLFEKMESKKMILNETDLSGPIPLQKGMSDKQDVGKMINNALIDKVNKEADKKKSYVILSEILPYSDRRELKVKFKLADIIKQNEEKRMNLIAETSEWLGNVYRATASICWNMLLNSLLTFDEIKILFTENIVFNFIEFMNELKNLGYENVRDGLTELINKKSCDILDFLCKQYPQTKIQAPNITLRQILPMIENQGRVKYDLVSKSGIFFTYRPDKDYTSQIMKAINFMIRKTNEEYEQFHNFMKDLFDRVYLPIHKRNEHMPKDLSQDDIAYKEKVKAYTSYKIGRKISKNNLLYTEEEIEDGIFFVKSTGVLRIITKWVQELLDYFQSSEEKIKNSYSQNKDHAGKPLYLSSLLKNGIHRKVLEYKDQLFRNIQVIKRECHRMELLLTSNNFTTDETQVHLSEQQILVGKYCSNLKSAISAYLCSQLNELIHFLLKIPRDVDETKVGIDVQAFQAQARKDLDNLNLVTFKLFDLLRCKCHSNEQQIIWIVQNLLEKNKDKDIFRIVRIKDRLGQGTRDIMINASLNKGLVFEIQLSVTSNIDKKQDMLDQYNHFLYELKRSQLGPITENVSIWATLQQRFSYFEQLIITNKSKFRKGTIEHNCNNNNMKNFTRPIICESCHNFYAIPQTCLLNVRCDKCSVTYCGECYYEYLGPVQRKRYIFEDLINDDVLQQMQQYRPPDMPLPPRGFFIKKGFLKKELAFYMAILKNKDEKSRNQDNVEILFVQTIVRNGRILNRQYNRKIIEAELREGEFYIKNVANTQINNLIIFSFIKEENIKKFLTLTQLQEELEKPENRKMKMLDIIREPSYISKLKLMGKEIDKKRDINGLKLDLPDEKEKLTVFQFRRLIILTQVCVKGGQLREEITKKVNISALKAFAYKQSDIVSMEYVGMTTELDLISTKMKQFLYQMFITNVRKLFLNNGSIKSIECLGVMSNLEFIVVTQNKLTSLHGVETLNRLVSIRFDENEVEDLLPLQGLQKLKFVLGNKNKLTTLKGLSQATELLALSVYENQITSIAQIKNSKSLQQLFLRQNPLESAEDVHDLVSLQKLFLGKTNVKHLFSFDLLKNLKALSLQSLNLTQIPPAFRGVRLTELWLSYNNITRIANLDQQTQLIMLNMKCNKISKLENLEGLQKLEVLKLENNLINVLENVRCLENLKVLNLKQNPLNDINELLYYEYSYDLQYSTLSQRAKKQLDQLNSNQAIFSSGDD